jgi:hypothetical protein
MGARAMVVRIGLEARIHLIRGERVMLDSDLAELYGVRTKELNKAVQRNQKRFPDDFMFRLSKREHDSLRFQSGTSNGRGGRRFMPFVFTQEGVAMLSSVLRSQRAVAVNLEIMRAFVRLRSFLTSRDQLALKLKALEKKFASHDDAIQQIFAAIKRLMLPPQTPRREIGFHAAARNTRTAAAPKP